MAGGSLRLNADFFLPCHSFAMGSQISYVKKNKQKNFTAFSVLLIPQQYMGTEDPARQKKKKKSHISV